MIQAHIKTYPQHHGSPHDRGEADSYYGRRSCPHKGGVGGGSGLRIEALTDDEVEAYMAGYAKIQIVRHQEGF